MDPYDKFMANKMINDKWCTIQWYVDYNKGTHISEEMVIGVINIMKRNFGELVVSCGKKHTFLVMDIELVNDVKINIGMKSYLKRAIKTFGEDI